MKTKALRGRSGRCSEQRGKAFGDFLDRYALQVGKWLPFTAANTIQRGLDKSNGSILDLGCNRGISMSIFNRANRLLAVGMDIHLPYLRECKRQKVYDEVLQGDVRMLPFKPKSFDIVFCGQLIEHLEKQDGWELIREMERIARRWIIITTPVGAYKLVVSWETPYLEHKSSWAPDELIALGYKVRGSSVAVAHVIAERFASHLPRNAKGLFTSFVFIMSALFDPVVYFCPKIAGNMVCIKELDGIEQTKEKDPTFNYL